ncbi:MAG: sulfur carrier protein ThiS [Verrucomicrobiae bacterium]|nr:sulfur carrier protein ThiS [Verrucomicrobiae bacterium]
MSAQKIVIFANGRARQLDGQVSVADFVSKLPLDPKAVLVEINGTALFREEWPVRRFEHGDRLEIVRVVAGG